MDIDARRLDGPGAVLRDAIGPGRTLDLAAPALLDDLPGEGWRVVHRRPAGEDRGASEVLAAPHPGVPGGWVLVDLREQAGARWLLSADPGPVVPRPGRSVRRAALRLTWAADPVDARAGVVPQLEVVLSTTAPGGWVNEASDDRYVAAWLTDDGGQRLPASSWVFHGSDPLPDLAPVASLLLPVDLRTAGIELLPPAVYGVRAVLVGLNLAAEPGWLRLT